MPLSETGMASEMKAAIEAAYGKPADDQVMLQKFCDAVSKTVIDHFIANGIVTSTGTVTSGTGSGGSTSSTGTIS